MINICGLNGFEVSFTNAVFQKIDDEYYIHCLTQDNDLVEIEQQIPVDGYYKLSVTHFTKNKSFHSLLIDGLYYGGIAFETAQGKSILTTEAFKLTKGTHKISLLRNWGELTFFSMQLQNSDQEHKSHQPAFELSNPKASKECHGLMDYFRSIYGKRIITGQHTDFNCADVDYIQRVTGKLPALLGFDLLSYSDGTKTKDATWECMSEVAHCSQNIDAALYWAKQKKALITLCWHWYSPNYGRDKSFYTVNTDFNLAKVLREKSHDYELMIHDMDLIADQLKRLRDNNIPVLWRPLHEADGKWFWWGASGPDAFIQLYRLMYERFTKVHELNNLIWVFNAPCDGWYPGDDVVDLTCMDIYGPKGNAGPLSLEYERGIRIPSVEKPIGLGEVGTIPDLNNTMGKSPWLWFMLWGGFTHTQESNSIESLINNFSSSYAVNLDEFSNIVV